MTDDGRFTLWFGLVLLGNVWWTAFLMFGRPPTVLAHVVTLLIVATVSAGRDIARRYRR